MFFVKVFEIGSVDIVKLGVFLVWVINEIVVCVLEGIGVGDVIIFGILVEMVVGSIIVVIFVLECLFYGVLVFGWFENIGRVEVIV